MNERDWIKHFLAQSGGDPHHALALAVRQLGLFGYHMSAGFVRAAPPRPILPPKEHVEPIDDPDTSAPFANPSA